MKRGASGFAAGTLPARLAPALPGGHTPPGLKEIAATFRALQEPRHAAEYDALRSFDRHKVLDLISRTERAMLTWASVATTDAGRLFVVALLVGDRVRE